MVEHLQWIYKKFYKEKKKSKEYKNWLLRKTNV